MLGFSNETPGEQSVFLGLTGSLHFIKWTQELGTESKHAWGNPLHLSSLLTWPNVWNITQLKVASCGRYRHGLCNWMVVTVVLFFGYYHILWHLLFMSKIVHYPPSPDSLPKRWSTSKNKMLIMQWTQDSSSSLGKNTEHITMNYRLENHPKGFPVRP